MLKNVIILTYGQSGSSVLTALIARAGFWLGDRTKKVEYDTFENAELVDLDRKLLEAAEIDWANPSVSRDTQKPPKEQLRSLVDTFDKSGPEAFLEKCHANRPWIWKDPRLTYAIHYWEAFLDLSQCHFIIMGRDLRQAWSAHMIKGRPAVSFARYRAAREGLLDVAKAFVRDRGLPHLATTFEDLVLQPSRVIAEVNTFIGTSLTLEDLKVCYGGPLGTVRWSRFDTLHAWLRYQAHRWILRDFWRPS